MVEIKLKGIPAAAGLQIGPVFRYQPAALVIPELPSGPFEEELRRFNAAVEQAVLELEELKKGLSARADPKTAAIFEAHAAMARDPMLLDGVSAGLRRGLSVEKSLREASEEIAELLKGMKVPLFAARSADVQDVADRILRILLGNQGSSFGFAPRAGDRSRLRSDPFRHRRPAPGVHARILHRRRRVHLAYSHPGAHIGDPGCRWVGCGAARAHP